MPTILFVESLHHPERLHEERQQYPHAHFPTSMTPFFYEKLMRQEGWQTHVFWRNIAWGSQDTTRIKAQRHSERITPSKVVHALLHRTPPRMNPDIQARNRALLKMAHDIQPDFVWLAGGNSVIYPETLATLKETLGARIIYLNGVSPVVFSHAMEREAARLYDVVLVNDYYHGMQWREMGAPNVTCLPYVAIDPDHHHPYVLSDEERQQYKADVSFVGTLVPNHLYSERVAALEALHQEYDVGIWTVHDVPASLRASLRGYALGDDMLRVLSGATISLNVHGDFMRYGGNMRLFESASVGAFQIVDARDGIANWFTPDEHLVTFSDVQDLRDKVAYYLAHPEERARIAESALTHVREHHTYAHRWKAIKALL
jgi:glycosyltransferase involved in cell wall biosynthesis